MSSNRGAFLSLLLLIGLASYLGVVGATVTKAADREAMKWCNAYAPVEIAQGWAGHGFGAGLEGNAQPLKIKYGKAVEADELGVPQALGWFGDVLFRPTIARDAQVMTVYPISELTEETITSLVERLSKLEGQEKPFFAVGASPDTLISTGLDISAQVQGRHDFIFTPVKWNADTAGSLRNASEGGSLKEIRLGADAALAHFAAYTMLNGINYGSVSSQCNPQAAVPASWLDFGIPLDALNGFYVAVNFEPEGSAFEQIKGRKVLTYRQRWPTKE